MQKQTFASRKKKPARLFSTKVHCVHPYHRSAVPWEPGLLYSLGEEALAAKVQAELAPSEIYVHELYERLSPNVRLRAKAFTPSKGAPISKRNYASSNIGGHVLRDDTTTEVTELLS